MIDPTEYLIATLMGTGINRATAEQLLAEHDAVKGTALLREAITRLDKECRANARRALYSGGLRHATTVVKALADEIQEKATPTGTTATPDFFQPGHTYIDELSNWKFRVDTVTSHPEDGERTALGWRYFKGQWDAIAYGEDDWEVHQHVGWSDEIKGGAR